MTATSPKRYVLLQARDGTWGVAQIGKRYRLMAQGLTKDAAKAARDAL